VTAPAAPGHDPFTSRAHLARAYGTSRELQARADLYAHLTEPFDLVAWVCDVVAALAGGGLVVDAGCGPGRYLAELRARDVDAVGADLSTGMAREAAAHGPAVVADAAGLPIRTGVAAVVLAAHVLYHLPDLAGAARELARVARPGAGALVVVLNGPGHLAELRRVVREASGVDQPMAERVNVDNVAELLAPTWTPARRAVRRGEVSVPGPGPVLRYVQSMRAMVEPHLSGFTNWSQVMARVTADLAGTSPDEPFVTYSEVGHLVFARSGPGA
jgi:SAM-dependent methyltransferase